MPFQISPARALSGRVFGLLALVCMQTSLAAVGPLPGNDAELVEAVQNTLERDRALSRIDLQVEAAAGVITLSGTAPTLQLKRQAVRRAAAQRGVLALQDHLEVDWRGHSDRAIRLRIRSRLAPYSDLRPPALQVQVQDGIVYAQGQLGTMGRLLFLDERLAAIEGVRHVDLSGIALETHRGVHPEDDLLRDAILSLLRHPLVFPVSGRIRVDVEQARVTLSGPVPRLVDRLEAAFVAGLLAGVDSIENNLEVDPAYGRVRVRDFSKH